VKHPLQFIPHGKLRRAMIPALVLTIATVGSLPFIMPLRDSGSGTVVELVEAGSATEVDRLVQGWSQSQRVTAAYAVGLDYLMTPAYMMVFAVALVWAARRTRFNVVRRGSIGFTWICTALPLTNVLENVMLRDAFLGEATDPWPLLGAIHHYSSGVAVLGVFALVGVAALFPASTPSS
jgi:hypothetical protein